MAATAEALLNTLAGGSDAGSAAEETAGTEDGNTGSLDGGDPSSSGTSGQLPSTEPGNLKAAATEAPANDAAKPTAEQLYQQSMAANREVRSENKALKAQLQELTARIEALGKPAVPAIETPQEPDFLADPKGYVDATKKQLAELTAKLENNEKQQTEQQKQQQAAQETWSKVLSAEAEFAATTPDYHDALNHVRGIRAEQIKIEIRETEDRDATQEEIARILNTQEAQGAAALIAKGKNPSRFYYEYAKTFGYKPKSAAPPPVAKPDKDAVRTMGSGGGAEHVGGDEPEGALGILAAAQSEHRAQFKRRK